jgi:hypothetical protein
MTGRVRRLLLALGPLAAAVAATACSSPLPPHVSIPGVTLRLDQDHAPLQAPGHDGVAALASVREPVSFGPLVLTNTTGHPITIVDVRPGRRDAGLAYLGVRASASQTRRVFSLGAAQGAFPYPSGGADWRPVSGVVVLPERAGGARGVEILVGVRADRPGRWSMRSVSVTYQIGPQRYVTTYGDTYTVCAPATTKSCDPVPAT